MNQEPGQLWHDGAYDTVYLVTRVWKHSIRMVNIKTGTTMQASKRGGMTEPNGWRCVKARDEQLSAATARASELERELTEVLCFAPRCKQCGKACEPQRWVYAVPTCYACLPPPPPIETFTFADPTVPHGPGCKCHLCVTCDWSEEQAKGAPTCEACGGDGYYKGPRLGDEPCPKCKGSGAKGAPQKPEGG